MSSTGDEISEADVSAGEASPYPGLSQDTQVTLGQEPSLSPVQIPDPDRSSDVDYEGSGSDYSGRENRFQGPNSTWRKHTQEERQLIASLDQQRANDLSIHLYNAHALKARLRAPDSTATTKPWQEKQRWTKPSEDEHLPWHPDRQWTAWPLPAEEVPRREEFFGTQGTIQSDDKGTFRKSEPWVPSADLEEEVQAFMLRKAVKRFRRRTWATADDVVRRDVSPEKAEPVSDADHSDVHTYDGRPAKLSEEEPSTYDAESTSLPEEKYFKPAFLADDVLASAILNPSVRQILTKLDDLLIGLDKSRQGHQRQTSASRSRSRTSTLHSKSRPQSPLAAGKPRGRSKGKHRASASEYEGSDSSFDAGGPVSGDDTDAPSPAQRQARSSGLPRRDLGLRDWSVVLGVASLVGWDQAVVDRAAQRCASLFGEGMSLRKMPETHAARTKDQLVDYVPKKLPLLESEAESDEMPSEQSDAELATEVKVKQSWACPYEDCIRHNDAYDRAWRLREHLRRAHKLSLERAHELQASLDHNTNAPTPSADGQLWLCPHEECPRHREAFALPWRWREHLKRVHKLSLGQAHELQTELGLGASTSGQQLPLPDTARHDSGDDESVVSEGDDEDMVGGVHADGFMQPIAQRSGRGGDKSARRMRSATKGRNGSKRRKLRPEEETDTGA